MGSAMLFIASAVELNLESKAKSLSPKTLSLIFLLNNYSYIKKNMQAEEMTKLAGSGFTTKYERLIAKCKIDYFTASWEKVQSYLDLSESDDLIAKSDRKAIKNIFSVCF